MLTKSADPGEIGGGFGFRYETYVVANSIRHLDELNSSNFDKFRSETLEGPFSAVSTPIFAIKYSLESS